MTTTNNNPARNDTDPARKGTDPGPHTASPSVTNWPEQPDMLDHANLPAQYLQHAILGLATGHQH